MPGAPTTRVVDGSGGTATMLKAALPAVPGVNRLPGVRRTGDTLPEITVSRPPVAVDRGHVDRYAAVCGFPTKDVAPLPYLHLLAFPLHMALMTDPAFPFPAIGTVHLENTIIQHRPVAIGESVEVAVTARDLRASTKGRAFDVVASATVDGGVVWESTSTYLRVGKGDPEHGDPGTAFAPVEPTAPEWRLPADLGRRYAAVSGDRNPIHLYPLTAKAFGFPRHIAHGMWSLARCVAALENRLPDAVRVDVGFKKPLFLPGRVRLGVRETEAGWDFSLTSASSGAPHLLGRTGG
ncbi:MaoC/PaaZ C-terminal domain-containing protein [Nocardioides sp. YIM 152588]|uniref:MaoC/PaaZ C-terminal domain-containing protein n=1 Tax=Nocardioides sp. YIM 152588 TaxID=3158259 RepID=UPI0032E37B0D